MLFRAPKQPVEPHDQRQRVGRPELLRLHEAITGERLGKDTFRRHMLGQLVETGAYQQGAVGKPAKIFRRA